MLERWPVQQSSTFMLCSTDTMQISFPGLSLLVSCLHHKVHESSPEIIYIACTIAANYTKSCYHKTNPYFRGAAPPLEDSKRGFGVTVQFLQDTDGDFCNSERNVSTSD